MSENIFFNRELSWLEFNARVLKQGLRKELPLLERVQFLSIVSSNFDEFFQVPDLTTWVGLSVVVAVFATFGDLVESLIKRTVGVKDSGHILPGHGGILDRIDSLLLVAPAVLIYLMLVVPNI